MKTMTAAPKTLDTADAVERFAADLKKGMLASLAAGHVITCSQGCETVPCVSAVGDDLMVVADSFTIRVALPEHACSLSKSV